MWERLGRIFQTACQRAWMQSHAQMPHAEAIEGSLVRIYFTCRDGENRSHIGWWVADLHKPDAILDLSARPLLAPGPVGRFDDAGAMSSWMVKDEGRRRFYVIGWNVRTSVPMHISIGMASGPAEGAPIIDERLPGPIFDRNPTNPYYVSCPCVLRQRDHWSMWYLSGLDWDVAEGQAASRYTVWRARSRDGLCWRPDPTPCLRFEHADEVAIARPCVVDDAALWRMWFSYRGSSFGYRIGYAESEDGETWRRRDDRLALPLGESGFDAEMACYPFVFDQAGERWMLYCGDGYGQAGIGLARLNGGAA